MHQMRSATNLDVTFDRGGFEGIEQPARVLVRDDAVPLASDQGDRCLHQSRVVTKLTVPRTQDVVEGPRRDFDSCRIPNSAAIIAVEIVGGPLIKVFSRQDGRLPWRYILDEPRPLVFHRDNPPGWARRSQFVTPWRASRDGAEQHPSVDHCRMLASKASGRHRSP